MTLILIISDRNNGSITHEVLDADEDMDSGDMLAAADRTSLPRMILLDTASGFMWYQLGYILHGAIQLGHLHIYHMASSIMVESLNLGEALVDEKKALVTYSA